MLLRRISFFIFLNLIVEFLLPLPLPNPKGLQKVSWIILVYVNLFQHSVILQSFALLWEFPLCGLWGLGRLGRLACWGQLLKRIFIRVRLQLPGPDQKPPTLDKPCLCIKRKILSCKNLIADDIYLSSHACLGFRLEPKEFGMVWISERFKILTFE